MSSPAQAQAECWLITIEKIDGPSMQKAILFWAGGLATLAGGAWVVCPQGQCAVPELDRMGLALAHAGRGDLLDTWMPVVTWAGSLLVLVPLIALAALVLARGGRGREAGFLVLSLVGASAFSHLAKLAVERPRPDLFAAWTTMPADWSYPSAHAMQVTAVVLACAFVFAQRRAKWGVVLAGIVLLVGLSRLYLQVHFPSDVAAGVIASAFWVAGLYAWMRARSPDLTCERKTEAEHEKQVPGNG